MLPGKYSSKASLLAVYEFVERVVDVHGGGIEAAARRAVGDFVATTPSASSQEMGRLLEDLLLASIQSAKGSLGSAWTRDKEQMPRQQSFESKPKAKSASEEKPSSTDVLASIFSVLIASAKNCPTFLVYLPATPGGDTEHDSLISRAVESAVLALDESDFEVARTAILFLKSTVRNQLLSCLGLFGSIPVLIFVPARLSSCLRQSRMC